MIYGQQGLRGFYRGTKASMWREVPPHAIYFISYEKMKVLFTRQGDSKPTVGATFMAAGFAGICYHTVAHPFDVLKTEIQSNPGMNLKLSDLIKECYHKYGWSYFVKGYVPNMCRAFPSNAIFLTIAD